MPEHVHKYKRVIMGGKRIVLKDGKKYIERAPGYMVYKCVLPGCAHYVPRELAEGRKSVCWRCGGELVMTNRNLWQVKPVHRECTRSVKAIA